MTEKDKENEKTETEIIDSDKTEDDAGSSFEKFEESRPEKIGIIGAGGKVLSAVPSGRKGKHIGPLPVIIAGIAAVVVVIGLMYGGFKKMKNPEEEKLASHNVEKGLPAGTGWVFDRMEDEVEMVEEPPGQEGALSDTGEMFETEPIVDTAALDEQLRLQQLEFERRQEEEDARAAASARRQGFDPYEQAAVAEAMQNDPIYQAYSEYLIKKMRQALLAQESDTSAGVNQKSIEGRQSSGVDSQTTGNPELDYLLKEYNKIVDSEAKEDAAPRVDYDTLMKLLESESGPSGPDASIGGGVLGPYSDNLGVGGARQTGGASHDFENLLKKKRDLEFTKTEYTASKKKLTSQRIAPQTPFEIKTGTIIPGVMISGINSDLPGQMIAQISQNVYDTATGNYLLIPQGSKLYGRYNTDVSYAQSRILVQWSRIIFPDASTLELRGMPGTDPSGYSGFKDKVDRHLLRQGLAITLLPMFSILPAVATSYIQAGQDKDSQPKSSTVPKTVETYEDQLLRDEEGAIMFDSSGKPRVVRLRKSQVASESESSGYRDKDEDEDKDPMTLYTGQATSTMADAATNVIERNLNIAPTIIIRPGYVFNIMVNRDIVFDRPYV